MALTLGTGTAAALKVGSTSVSKLYLGGAEVWTSVPCTQSVLLLHFDGSDESQSTNDSSASAHGDISFGGDAQIDTSESKFGGSSLYLDGTDDYVSVPYSTDFDFDTGDFTIEFWFRLSSAASQQVPISAGGYPNGWTVYVGGTEGLSFAAKVGSWVGANANVSVSANTWTHAAIVRNSGVLKGYIDGSEVVSDSTNFSGSITANESNLLIGIEGSSFDVGGHIDELRVVKGLAVYQAAFTPPSSPLSACAAVYA